MGRALPLSGQRRHCLGKTAPWGRQSFSLSLSSLCSSHSGFIISVQGPCRAQALPVNWRGAPRAARLGVIIIALRARKVHVYMTMLASPARFLARELALRGALPRPSREAHDEYNNMLFASVHAACVEQLCAGRSPAPRPLGT